MTTTRPTIADLPTIDARRGSAVIELSEDASSYTATRLFGAPPERIFQAFTDPADLRVWFPSGAPPGSELTVCESDPTVGSGYHYVMTIPEMGDFAWHGTYTVVDRPDRLDADEWFVMGGGDPDGEPAAQTLTFEAVDGGGTFLTMFVQMPAPEDPEEFMERSAAGLTTSLDAIDALVG